MTASPEDVRPLVPVARKGSVPWRIVNWFWRGQEMRELLLPAPPELTAFKLRAQVAADVARRTEDSPVPFAGSVDAILCDLYRQSIYWSRSALSAHAPSPIDGWAAIDHALQSRAVPDASSLTRVHDVVDSGSFDRFASLSEEDRQSLLPALRNLALALLAEVEVDRRALQALVRQRRMRLGFLVGLLAIIALVQSKAAERAEVSRDLALGKPWRASSTGFGACVSPAQQCDNSPDFFFHTQEEQRPWLEIDLGAPQSISAVRVDNRNDCCAERAAPITLEVSSDERRWQKVARRDSVFSTWLAKFPRVSARWVRLRLEKRQSLHLQRVRVLR